MHTTQIAPRLPKPDLLFWAGFLLLNSLLFLPFFLLNIRELHTADTGNLSQSLATRLFRLFIWREYPDPFRINGEWVLLLALWVNVGWIRRGFYRWTVISIYLIALLYYSYESVMVYLYRGDPVFYNHYFMIRDGALYLMENLGVSSLVYLGTLFAVVVVMAGILLVLRTLIDRQLPEQLSRTTRAILIALAAACLVNIVAYRTVSADPHMVVSSLTFKLEQNIDASLELYRSIVGFDDSVVRNAYDYTAHNLAQQPNIYLIFIESYGSVLYKRPDWRVAYTDMIRDMDADLKQSGLHMASALSEPPTWGGGSWLAYTSALFGLRMEAHPQYLALMERYGGSATTAMPLRYPDLGTYLRRQGYYYLWATSIATELKDEEWERYTQFYNVNRWLRYSDLDYDGLHYGWGPAPPDEYVLGYVHDEVLAEVEQPHFMFYITQNSHYPWAPLPELAEDWRALDDAQDESDPDADEVRNHAERRQRYLDSIDYTLRMLTDFILKNQDENALFVLIGDHQPPRVSRRDDGYETPIHIVSRSRQVVGSLQEYGFVDGGVVNPAGPTIKHEGIYSMLVRTLVQNYGADPQNIPSYLPNGATPPSWLVESKDGAEASSDAASGSLPSTDPNAGAPQPPSPLSPLQQRTD